MVSFLTIVSVPIYLYSNYGRVRLFLRPSQGCGFWVSPCNPEWWVPTTLPTPLIYHILNFHLAPHRGGWYFRRPLGAMTWKAETVDAYWWRSVYSLGFALVNPPLLHKEAVNQFYPAIRKRN